MTFLRLVAVWGVLLPAMLANCAPPRIAASTAETFAAPLCEGRFTGPGARPVSRSSVANWYITDGQLRYAVLLRGEPGWYDRRTNWHQRLDSAGTFVQEFDVGGFRYDLVYDAATDRLLVSGTAADTRHNNVVFVERRGDSLRIVGGEQQVFCWHSPPDVAEEIFQRSPAAVEFVSGRPGA